MNRNKRARARVSPPNSPEKCGVKFRRTTDGRLTAKAVQSQPLFPPQYALLPEADESFQQSAQQEDPLENAEQIAEGKCLHLQEMFVLVFLLLTLTIVIL